jgi:hypothetical protein
VEALLIRLTWRMRRLNGTLGLIGWVGVGLIVLAGFVLLASYLPALREARHLSLEREQLGAATGRASGPSALASSSPAAQLDEFYRFLAPDARIPEVLESLGQVAARNGVRLESGEFKLVTESNSRIGQYQMAFPVKAEYQQVRKFLRQVLKEHPQIALEEIGFRRENPDSSALEARVRFTLYVLERP